MQVTCSLKESDIVYLSEYQIERSDSIRRRRRLRRITYLVGFGFLSIGAYRILESPGLPLLFGALAIASFGLYPMYARWVTRRNLVKIVRERSTPETYENQILRAADDGLEQITGYSQSKINWSHVDSIEMLDNRAVVTVQGVPSLIIPSDGLIEGELDSFVEQVDGYIRKAAG